MDSKEVEVRVKAPGRAANLRSAVFRPRGLTVRAIEDVIRCA